MHDNISFTNNMLDSVKLLLLSRFMILNNELLRFVEYFTLDFTLAKNVRRSPTPTLFLRESSLEFCLANNSK